MVGELGHTVAYVEGRIFGIGILRCPAVVESIVDEACELAGKVLESLGVKFFTAYLIAEVAKEREVLVAEVGDETSIHVGLWAADDGAVIVVDDAVAVEVGYLEMSGLERVAVIIGVAH